MFSLDMLNLRCSLDVKVDICPAGIYRQVSLLDGRSPEKKVDKEEKGLRPISESHHYLEIREIKEYQVMKLSMRTQ